ncbi:MAG: hemerythrin family protein [Myxococcales bacterium]|nr:hemerythrin family protein [Myxococcales bacterium]
MPVSWTPDLSIGVEKLDLQHQQIFAALDDLLAAMRQGKGKAEVGRTLAFLVGYVAEHFVMEERTMRESGYPGLESHRGEHEVFARDVRALKSVFDTYGATSVLAIDVTNRVVGWLRDHILRRDVEMARYLNSLPPRE